MRPSSVRCVWLRSRLNKGPPSSSSSSLIARVSDGWALDILGYQLDGERGSRNEDYAERRVVPVGLRAPLVEAMPADGFRTWMKSRGKLGGQHKVPRVIDDQRLLADLR